MNKALSKYYNFYSYGTSKKKEMTEDQVQNTRNQQILDSIMDDDDEKFFELISQNISFNSNPNQTFTLTNYKLPEIMRQNPTYACLCAFFGSEKCFETLCTLLPGGCDSQEMKILDDWSRSPVHFACAGGNLTILRELESAGYDLNAADKDGCIPSNYAAMAGQITIQKFLWTKGAEIVSYRQFLNTPTSFEIACLYGQTEMVKFLYEQVAPSLKEDDRDKLINGQKINMVNSFHLAMNSGNSDLVDYLLSIDELVDKQINHVDHNGYTPFCYACMYGSLSIVKKLVSKKL